MVTKMKPFNIVSLAFLLLSSSVSAAQSPLIQNKLPTPLLSSLSATEQDDDDSNDEGDVIYHQCYLNPVSCF